MRFLKVFIAGIVLLVGIVLWIFSSVGEARANVDTLCNTTRYGEPWPLVEQRGRERGLTFEKVSSSRAKGEQHRTWTDAMGRRFGCTITLDERGRVIEKHASELPLD